MQKSYSTAHKSVYLRFFFLLKNYIAASNKFCMGWCDQLNRRRKKDTDNKFNLKENHKNSGHDDEFHLFILLHFISFFVFVCFEYILYIYWTKCKYFNILIKIEDSNLVETFTSYIRTFVDPIKVSTTSHAHRE